MDKAESTNNKKLLTLDAETEDPPVNKESNSIVMPDKESVHKDVEHATTVILIDHDFAINHPNIGLAELATKEATETNFDVATATKLMAFAGHIECTK